MKKLKKSIVKKPVTKKHAVKKKVTGKKPVAKRKTIRHQKEVSVSLNEIIFDWQVGKTDALFVVNPETLPEVKPEETIKTSEISFLETTPKDANQSQILANLNGHKRTFWQKFLSLFKKL